ncbi:asparagine synthetase B family protein [Roseateles oligotrophus]|uniref:asparagine synthase (glutamine-hydrolyzing) n=1 Tax=Roseateles oligotrophus TaxID=1769250 RepID=A0ABT2YFE8_9BURK|nr:asparagine synthase C-terminal domain-containing protein [Roseateles oligotrophus]MCV2368743.1 asparagine synthase C-terminal domain-containing protein [Roseateles oligotrophus]
MHIQNSEWAVGAPRYRNAALAAAHKISATGTWQQFLLNGGVDKLTEVDGDFAFAVTLPDGSQVAAVDRFAIQTMCYYIDDGQICFATSAGALAVANSEIDPQAIFDYIYFHCIPSPRTIYKNVYRIPPGHYVSFKNGELTVAQYWRTNFKSESAKNFNEASGQFRQILKDSVERQLDGSKPACFLSGGTDSSTVAGMIREATGQGAASYSIGFEAEGYDEMSYARLAAKHFGSEHHEYYVTPDDLVRSIPSVAAHYDQPFGNSSALPAYYCALKAKQDGVTRILAGDGGDELFGGNSRYAKQRVFGWWQNVPSSLRRGLLEPILESAWAGRTHLLKKGHSYVEQAKVAMPARLQMYNLLLRLGIDEVLAPEFLNQVNVNGPAQHQQSVWDSIGPASELNTTLAFDWRYTLGESDLPKVRETTRMAGVSVGFPMLDTALLDFSLTLPDDYKLRGLKLRWFFKEALRGFLPDEILVKKKQGFGLPFGVWLTRSPKLFELASDSVQTLSQRGIVNRVFIDSLLKERLLEHSGYYGEKIWILMMLEQWLRAHSPNYRIP